jgi:hypothetical protein
LRPLATRAEQLALAAKLKSVVGESAINGVFSINRVITGLPIAVRVTRVVIVKFVAETLKFPKETLWTSTSLALIQINKPYNSS